MFCNRCGKEISEQTRVCDCGNEIEDGVIQNGTSQNKNQAINSYIYRTNINQNNSSDGCGIAGFILGLLSVFSFCIFYISLPFSIIGLILSIVQMSKSKTSLSIAGLVLSILGILLAGIIIIVAILITVGSIVPPANFPIY